MICIIAIEGKYTAIANIRELARNYSICDSGYTRDACHRPEFAAESYSTRMVMKRFAQLVALVAALLIAAQPLLAEPSCASAAANGCAPVCCTGSASVHAHHISAECGSSMSSEMGGSECNVSGCESAPVETIPQLTKPATEVHGTGVAIIVSQPLPAAGPHGHRHIGESTVAPTPAKYLLFQTFRI